jgi:uncharacterized membrane protein YfcA
MRSAALLGFGLECHTFLATATAIALFVDGARMPVYFYTYAEELRQMTGAISASIAGVIIGTISGERVLHRIPEAIFRAWLRCCS